MDEYWIGGPQEAAARNLGHDAARSFFDNPAEGESMEAFVIGDVTGEIVRLTGTAQKMRQSEIKAWRRRQFAAPIVLAILGIVMSVVSTPGPNGRGSSIAYALGFIGLAGGAGWLIVTALRASQRVSESQRERESETGRLLTIAREAAAATYLELGGGRGGGGGDNNVRPDAVSAEAAELPAVALPADATPHQSVEGPEASADNKSPKPPHIPTSPAPPGQPFGVTQEGAAYLVAAWMRHLGDADAGTTDSFSGAGLDAASSRCGAKARNEAESVGGEEVRGLVAAAAGRRALFFASGSYSEEAQAVAEEWAVALFTYDAVAGTLDGANGLGRTAMVEGLL